MCRHSRPVHSTQPHSAHTKLSTLEVVQRSTRSRGKISKGEKGDTLVFFFSCLQKRGTVDSFFFLAVCSFFPLLAFVFEVAWIMRQTSTSTASFGVAFVVVVVFFP